MKHRRPTPRIVTSLWTCLSAVAISALAAVGSYVGTYHALVFLFETGVEAPVAAPVAHDVPATPPSPHLPTLP